MGFWSTCTRRRTCSSPALIRPPLVCGASSSRLGSSSLSSTRPRPLPTSSSSAWLTRLDLPEPEIPVTDVKQPNGKSTFKSLRLLRVTPSNFNQPLGSRRNGFDTRFSANKYSRVCDASICAKPAGGPLYNTCPPCSPAAGPTSISQSARRMVSRSCSTTNNELPAAFRRSNALNSASPSAGCKPAEGSSST